MEQLLIVLSNSAEGRDDEFNEWYSWVHVRDVMRLSPGAIAAQRFALTPEQLPGAPPGHRYLAIYEADAHAGFSTGHADVFTEIMPISETFRFDDFRDAYYRPIAAIDWQTDRTGASDAIVERLPAQPDDAFARWYAAQRFPALMRLPGVTEGVFSEAAAEQMLPVPEDAAYMAVYRTTDRHATLCAWAALEREAPPPWEADRAWRGCYAPVMGRLTAAAARHPSEAEAARAGRARAALGRRVYRGFPAGVADNFVRPG
ncbi:MAG TPA: hypothetical protein VMB71_02350 [Acetobacteraceae bacterium]|nr:hypothetical protein [Acetobacteraceae bacterium]